MPKKVLATNCRIVAIPKGCSAKINGTGTAVITVPDDFESDLSEPSVSEESYIMGLHIKPFDEKHMCMIGLASEDFDETGFHDFQSK